MKSQDFLVFLFALNWKYNYSFLLGSISNCSQGARFLLFNTSLTFDNAVAECSKVENSSLARISTVSEYNLVLTLIQSLSFTEKFWIGISDFEGVSLLDDSSRFSFVDEDQALDFIRVPNGAFPWLAGEPNGNCQQEGCLVEDCVEWQPLSNNSWSDIDCAFERPFLCRSFCSSEGGNLNDSPDLWKGVLGIILIVIFGVASVSVCIGFRNFVENTLEELEFDEHELIVTERAGTEFPKSAVMPTVLSAYPGKNHVLAEITHSPKKNDSSTDSVPNAQVIPVSPILRALAKDKLLSSPNLRNL